MKRRELEKTLKYMGWWLHRNGSRHDIWTNGKWKVQLPRHHEVSEGTANDIIKEAQGKK